MRRTTRQTRLAVVTPFVSLVFMLLAVPLMAGEATRQIQTTVETALKILQDKDF
ncbi:MAG: hypothetical protein HQL53_10920, partial [Magnetococcales bacterium]|nr:hypothetical protein [Magnetococcales bacterium]